MFRGGGLVEDGRNIFVLRNILSSHKTQLVARQKKNEQNSLGRFVCWFIYIYSPFSACGSIVARSRIDCTIWFGWWRLKCCCKNMGAWRHTLTAIPLKNIFISSFSVFFFVSSFHCIVFDCRQICGIMPRITRHTQWTGMERMAWRISTYTISQAIHTHSMTNGRSKKKKTNCAESRILVATLEWPCHFVETSWDDPIGRHCDGSELMYLMHTNVLYVLRTHRNWLCNTSSLISISNGEAWCVEEWSTMSGYGRGWWLLSTTKVCQTSRGNKTTTTTKK